MARYVSRVRCPICGVEFPLTRNEGGAEVICPNGHVFYIDHVMDCEGLGIDLPYFHKLRNRQFWRLFKVGKSPMN